MNESYDYARRQLVALVRQHESLAKPPLGQDSPGLRDALLFEANEWALIVIALREQHGS